MKSCSAYYYCPQADHKVMARWKSLYTVDELAGLQEIVDLASNNDLNFMYCLRFPEEVTKLDEKVQGQVLAKLRQVQGVKVDHFCMLFDLMENDNGREISLGQAQANLANFLLNELKPTSLAVLPTECSPSLVVPSIQSSPYLRDLGRHLKTDIKVAFMADTAIHAFIHSSTLSELADVIQRPPLIWEGNDEEAADKKSMVIAAMGGGKTDHVTTAISGIVVNLNSSGGPNLGGMASLTDFARLLGRDSSARTAASTQTDAIKGRKHAQSQTEGSGLSDSEKAKICANLLSSFQDVGEKMQAAVKAIYEQE